MILQDSALIWITTRRAINLFGEMENHYTDLRMQRVNAQCLSNETEAKTFGAVANNVLEIRTDSPPDFSKGDHIYMVPPTEIGSVEIDGVGYVEYPAGDYEIESIKPAYVGGKHIYNPTLSVARVVIK